MKANDDIDFCALVVLRLPEGEFGVVLPDLEGRVKLSPHHAAVTELGQSSWLLLQSARRTNAERSEIR